MYHCIMQWKNNIIGSNQNKVNFIQCAHPIMYVKIHAKFKANMKQSKFASGEISIIDGVKNAKFYL